MPIPLLETKLFVPSSRREPVPRPRLSERLARWTESKLLLVSAPAGFGKSTLLADWLATINDDTLGAWLSLDAADDDPLTFWSYLIAALQTAAPELGAGALTLLQTSRPAPIEGVLTSLLNDLGRLPDDVVLVLDDYHLVTSREVQEGMAFLLEHAPPRLHLVIACRSDPALPLARFRARGELAEIRAAELRFTPDEAATYLNGVMELALTAQDVAALESRTEGWIAALQLAALSMQGRDDVAGFITGFAGDDRYVVDYLVEEVLQRQSALVQRFLMQTAVLERMSGSLCDAVTGQAEGRATLDALDRGNLFLVPLDDRREWYRYHHLFADVLRARLLDEQPALVSDLHRRASAWWAQHGDLPLAIDHSLAAEDFARAAELVEVAAPAMRRDRREATLLDWLQRLPDEEVRRRPVLCVSHVGALLATNHVEGVEARLQDAERWLAETADTSEMVVVDEAEYTRLPGQVWVYRAGLAMATGDAAATVLHARRALSLLEDDDHLGHGSAAALIGLASWAGGDLEAAHEAYTECTARLTRAEHFADVLGCSVILADIRVTQGRLREAMRTYEQALQLGAARGGPTLRGTPDMHVGMSSLHRERGDLQLAAQLLLQSEELGEAVGLPQYAYRWQVAMARLREAEGHLDASLEMLDLAERLYVGDFLPDVRPVPAFRARVWVAQGLIGDALGWAQENGISVDDELSYMREFEHVTLARTLIAKHRIMHAEGCLDAATGLLERLLRAAEDGGRTGTVIEVQVLLALAVQLRQGAPAALPPLERALTLAEPEGYLRVFVDEGTPMAVLLKAAEKQRISRGYVSRLLAAMAEAGDVAPGRPGLVEPLSVRELAVLRLLGSELGGPDIARELTVSLNTVRTHTRNIYAKLGVNNRRAAVRRAAELHLPSQRDDRHT